MKKRHYISGVVLIGLALVIGGLARAEDVTLTTYYPAPYGAYQELLAERYGRPAHHNGALVGSYNNVGANSYKSSPIYVIGSSYQPTDAALSNMYGIGYTHTNASFITDPGPNSWGMYVAADGDARIFLAASASGSSYFNTGNVGIGT
ncbi:hypothetical protein KA005_80790, partial [bacterium]|nr:hypothetical protein [bacterium]